MKQSKEFFAELTAASQLKRKLNRESSPEALQSSCIAFETKNAGAHLIVQGRHGLIDFWPGTGKWKSRSGIHGRGVFKLIASIRRGDT